jgi:SpoVK/Ycf46/Vps4 family AAA+-type ATPase
VKKELMRLVKQMKSNYDVKSEGKDPIPLTINRVFTGPPGAGKTTVAKLYGQIIVELGLVSLGEVIMKDAIEFTSEEVAKKIIDGAMGNVLVIDDVHMMHEATESPTTGSDFTVRQRIVDTLLESMSSKSGEDRCIILVSEEVMIDNMLKRNPELQERFNPGTLVRLESYNVDQLCGILDLKLAKDSSQISTLGKSAAREALSGLRLRPEFRNGADVDDLLARAKSRCTERLEAAGTDASEEDAKPELLTEDFDSEADRAGRADKNRDVLFEGFVGFEKIKKQFQEYQQISDGMRRRKLDPKPWIPWAFVFQGPPGTGKT